MSVTVPRLSHRVSLLGRVRHATNIKPKGKRSKVSTKGIIMRGGVMSKVYFYYRIALCVASRPALSNDATWLPPVPLAPSGPRVSLRWSPSGGWDLAMLIT